MSLFLIVPTTLSLSGIHRNSLNFLVIRMCCSNFGPCNTAHSSSFISNRPPPSPFIHFSPPSRFPLLIPFVFSLLLFPSSLPDSPSRNHISSPALSLPCIIYTSLFLFKFLFSFFLPLISFLSSRSSSFSP